MSDLVRIASDLDLDLYLYQDSDLLFLCFVVWFDLYSSLILFLIVLICVDHQRSRDWKVEGVRIRNLQQRAGDEGRHRRDERPES